MQASRDIGRLVDIMRALRTPHTGCPWDLEQSFDSIVPYTVEETFEVVDAIERRDAEDLCEELGDLLLQVVYYCQLAEEEGLFTLGDVVEGITGKMIRRHPHVFGDAEARSAGSAKGQWNRIKAEEKALRAERRAARTASSASGEWAPKPVPETAGLLDAVPGALPSLALAMKVQEKAANVGFDWKTPEPIIAKIREEIAEFEEAQDAADPIAQEDELGDILFSVVNLARATQIDPDAALRRTTAKFRKRFSYVEQGVGGFSSESGRSATLERMEALWQEAKTKGS
ncbi:nucleoside triphosphate pyrophosphohydrolase [Aureimonas sp. OT7]|uniref:nucleoside triphosphate pyrophosphohydrolase n=1 Tax=Aureimonas sp. OT7 TaxID=2816454 RepID=UPI00177B2592|nr:nucleoside triphosphate pyrophosphohydrolase [Aureimonas sp. OT7]QOG05504.1 nucleoside triphosphate pyrophosphohydrolase [Aureimonas sp. OT7]